MRHNDKETEFGYQGPPRSGIEKKLRRRKYPAGKLPRAFTIMEASDPAVSPILIRRQGRIKTICNLTPVEFGRVAEVAMRQIYLMFDRGTWKDPGAGWGEVDELTGKQVDIQYNYCPRVRTLRSIAETINLLRGEPVVDTEWVYNNFRNGWSNGLDREFPDNDVALTMRQSRRTRAYLARRGLVDLKPEEVKPKREVNVRGPLPPGHHLAGDGGQKLKVAAKEKRIKVEGEMAAKRGRPRKTEVSLSVEEMMRRMESGEALNAKD
jgi:hypothetical protein